MPDDTQPNDVPDRDARPGQQQSQEDSWTPPTSQEELDRLINKATAKAHKKYADYDAIKAKAEQFDTLSAASQTDQERVATEAQEKGFNAALAKTVPRLVRAEFRAAAKGLLSKDQLDALLEDVDLAKYVDDDGEPDVERIERKISAVAPKAPTPSFGQGARGQAPKAKDMNDFIRQVAGLR